jgi:hypothetical protein
VCALEWLIMGYGNGSRGHPDWAFYGSGYGGGCLTYGPMGSGYGTHGVGEGSAAGTGFGEGTYLPTGHTS